MPLIPIKVGDRSAMVDIPGKPVCSVPGCNGEHWTACDYPVGDKLATAHTCDAKLCKDHVVEWGKMEICPPHARLVAKAGR